MAGDGIKMVKGKQALISAGKGEVHPASFFFLSRHLMMFLVLQAKEALMSVSAERGKRFVKVKDSSGNEWLCPLDAMKSAKDATQEELDDCVELDVVIHTAGDIDAER